MPERYTARTEGCHETTKLVREKASGGIRKDSWALPHLRLTVGQLMDRGSRRPTSRWRRARSGELSGSVFGL